MSVDEDPPPDAESPRQRTEGPEETFRQTITPRGPELQARPDYGFASDHDQLPELTISEEQLEAASREVFGDDDEIRIVPVTSLFDSKWSRAFDQFYQERIVHVRSNNVLLLRFAYTYEVDLCRIRNKGALLAWVLHLCEKPWMNCERLQMFARAVGAIKKFNLHGP